MTSIDDSTRKVERLHLLVERATDECNGAEDYLRFELHAAEDEAEAWRSHRRQLERDLAHCLHCADVDGVAVVRTQIELWERGVQS